jgi:hypothetical protein
MDKESSFGKFSNEDEKYLDERKKAAEDIGMPGLFDSIDQFGLYAGVQTIGKSLAVYEILKTVSNIPGNIFEFGCWRGSNLLLMAKILKLLQPNTIKEIYGFESFEGLKTFSDDDGLKNKPHGSYKGNEEILRKMIALYGFGEWVNIIKGDATKTIKEFESKNPHILISMAYLDFDLYDPTKIALEFVHSRLSIGGVIVFDQAGTHDWKGEGKAMVEFLKEHGSAYEYAIIPFVRQPTIILKKVARK